MISYCCRRPVFLMYTRVGRGFLVFDSTSLDVTTKYNITTIPTSKVRKITIFFKFYCFCYEWLINYFVSANKLYLMFIILHIITASLYIFLSVSAWLANKCNDLQLLPVTRIWPDPIHSTNKQSIILTSPELTWPYYTTHGWTWPMSNRLWPNFRNFVSFS